MCKERDNIIKIAGELFRKNGLSKTSMDEIAAELQISKKTIYKFFPSKDHLIDEMINYWHSTAEDKINDVMKSGEDVINKMVKLLEDYSCDATQISDKFLRDLQIHYPAVWEKIENFRSNFIYDLAKKLILQGIKEKDIKEIPEELIITAHLAAIKSVINPNFLILNNLSMQKALEYVYAIEFSGILTEKGKKKFFNKMNKNNL